MMSIDYDKIREDNIREYGEGTRHLAFLGRLYTDRTHFIFELLQNAEDAGATKILFKLFNDRLEVSHNGRPFNERDVKGVCGVGEGTKTEDLTQIGKFGIGFKSVYAYTATPEIHSGNKGFRIESYVRPYAAPFRLVDCDWTTLFVFPFDVVQISPETASKEIAMRLRNLSARTLLFLRKIEEIEYKLPDSTGGMYLREEFARASGRQVSVLGHNNGKDEEENWLIFERSVTVANESASVHVEVSFLLEAEDMVREHPERIIKVKDSPLVVYFPTEKATRFGFLIQGPYRTTPSRDNIPKDDEWNEALVKKTAELVRDVLPVIRDLGLLTVSFLEVLPIRVDDFRGDSMFYPIVESVRDALIQEELLPADDGSFVSAANAKLARGADLRKILNQTQLCQFYNSSVAIKWLAGGITQDHTPDARSYLINELDVEEVTPDSFSRKIHSTFLVNQPDQWFIVLYRYLAGQEALWRAPRWKHDLGGTLRSKPIIRLENNKQQAPFGSDGITPNAFLPPIEETNYPIVKRSIAADEQSFELLKRLGLSEPDVFDDIVGKVLPKYTETSSEPVTEKENLADVRKIIRAMVADSDDGKQKVVRVAIQTPFLKSINLIGEIIYKKPVDIYLNTPELKKYFLGSQEVWFLHDDYDEFGAEVGVWCDLGVFSCPKKLPISEGLPSSKKEYSTRREIIENYEMDGLKCFLQSIPKLMDFAEQKSSALLLWNFLRHCLAEDGSFFEARYQWFYYSQQHKYFDSMMLVRLQTSKWIPTKDGRVEKPGDITTHQLPDEFLKSRGLIESLGIIKNSDRNEYTQKYEYATELGVSLEDIEFLKSHRDEVEQLKIALANRKERPAFPTRSIPNKERRQEQLGQQFSSTTNKKYENRNRSIRITVGTIDPTTWLRNQYTNDSSQMVCQICKEEMPFRKRDGNYYFENKEVLTRKFLTKEHEAQYLALCPLCFAKYREFITSEESAMIQLSNDILNAQNFEVPISFGDENASIRFVETHLCDLQTIIECEG